MCFRNWLAGCAKTCGIGLFCRNYRPLFEETGWLGSDFICVSLETRWLGLKPCFLIPGSTLYPYTDAACASVYCLMTQVYSLPATSKREGNTHLPPPPFLAVTRSEHSPALWSWALACYRLGAVGVAPTVKTVTPCPSECHVNA